MLLVATPRITQEVFRRGVVLVLHHDEEGAHGLVLNKPLGVDVERVLPGWSRSLSAPAELFQGGPVCLDTALGLACLPDARTPAGVHRLFDGIGVVDLDTAPEALAAQVAGVRVFAGYAGWGAGQLESELREGSWYVVVRGALDAFCTEPSRLWRTVLERQTGRLAFVASYPEEPSWN